MHINATAITVAGCCVYIAPPCIFSECKSTCTDHATPKTKQKKKHTAIKYFVQQNAHTHRKKNKECYSMEFEIYKTKWKGEREKEK